MTFSSNRNRRNISDKHLTATLGLLDLLKEGDAVMADRGFTISDLLDPINATCNVPPRVEVSLSQLTECDRIEIRHITLVIVYIECAFRQIKNFHILHLITNSVHSSASQIAFVCAFLTNL